ncbi:MAG: family 10 glycosylhydrolase [Ignavibacteriales bacterium]|nr:family 10 glycosylhydrolase [Ignavibacteriales bacterium]
MKKVILIFLVLLFLCPIVFGQTNNQEFRSIWVVTWEWISGSTVQQKKDRICKIFDDLKSANFTSVLFQVRQSGTAYYNSSYEPWGFYLGYTNPGFDPLEFAVEEAHKRGMELHAWFNVFNVSSTYSGTIAATHPEWICVTADSTIMTKSRSASPGLEEVREYTINVAMEIVRNYDIDGLHLDYVRWSEYDKSDMLTLRSISVEEELSRLDGQFIGEKDFKPDYVDVNRFLWDYKHMYDDGIPTGHTSWENWWRWSTTEFVRVLHDSIQSIKPWVRLTPAALGKYKTGGDWGWNGYYVVYQDAALWFNQGYVDQLTPMHYHWMTGTSLVSAINSDWKPNITAGLDSNRLYSVGPGSYLITPWENHEGIVSECRKENWLDGFQFFSYASWENNNYWDEARNKFFTSKTKIRPINTVSIPAAPVVSLQKIDSLHYQITVTPDVLITENHWFAIYRSDDASFNLNNDEIVSVHFSDTTFTFDETFDYVGHYYGTYHYYATCLNRYWNESDMSNSVETDTVDIPLPLLTSAPTHIRVLQNDANSLKIECDSIFGTEKFIVYRSTDGTNFSLYDSTDSHNMIVSGLTENTIYYFKLSAWNYRGETPVTQDVYAGIPSSSNNSVLVVDGFDRGTNTRRDYVRFCAVPIRDRSYAFSHCLNETVIDGFVNLDDFDIVIWILGDESTADETFSSTEQTLVSNYLKAGGKLLVSGSEIGWDLGRSGVSSPSDISFYNNYLKSTYVADAPLGASNTYYNVETIGGGLFNGLSDFSFDNGSHGTFNVSWPDAILKNGGSVNILKYKNVDISNGGAGIVFQGTFPSGSQPGAIVHFGFPFETVYPEANRIAIMSKVFDVFEGLLDIELIDNKIPTQYALKQNYPNPFNPTTTISFSIPEMSNVKLTVYDILGQEISVLVNEQMNAGNYSFNFNASGLASGVYIYEIRANDFVSRMKMILLK